jgi:hypothetical protein
MVLMVNVAASPPNPGERFGNVSPFFEHRMPTDRLFRKRTCPPRGGTSAHSKRRDAGSNDLRDLPLTRVRKSF